MTQEQAKRYISDLSREQKMALNEMLRSLEQMRQPSPARPG